MQWFKRTNKMTDERIINTQNKIYREMYSLVMVICFISIAVKYYLYGTDLANVLTELAILFSGGVYYLIRSTGLGIFSEEVEIHDRTSKLPMSRKNLYFGLGLGAIIALLMGLNSAVNYADSFIQSIYYFVLVFFISFLIYVPFFALVILIIFNMAKKRSQQISEEDLEDNKKR